MIPKLPEARNNRLIIIQFLDDNELKTGCALANNLKQSSPYIEHVDYYESHKGKKILEIIEEEIPKIISDEDEIALYIDTHGFPSKNGIGHNHDFLSWEDLKKSIGEAFKNQKVPPIIILTACNGYNFNNELRKDKNPICSKLIASEGLLPDGIVMGAFSELFYKYGIKLGSQVIDKLNQKIDEHNKKVKDTNFSHMIVTVYLAKESP